jgi:hypothetical protein
VRLLTAKARDELRRYLPPVVRTNEAACGWLTPAVNTERFDARIAVQSTSHVVEREGATVVRQVARSARPLPSCRSNQLDSVYDSRRHE